MTDVLILMASAAVIVGGLALITLRARRREQKQLDQPDDGEAGFL